jgi:hypothetical protein
MQNMPKTYVVLLRVTSLIFWLACGLFLLNYNVGSVGSTD